MLCGNSAIAFDNKPATYLLNIIQHRALLCWRAEQVFQKAHLPYLTFSEVKEKCFVSPAEKIFQK